MYNSPFLIRIDYILIILLLLKTTGLSFPFGANFLYFRLSLLFFVLYLAYGKIYFRLNTGLLLIVICIIFYLFALIHPLSQTYGLHKSNIIDVANIIILLFLWLMIGNFDKSIYDKLLSNFIKYAVFTSFIVAILSIYKLDNFLQGIQLDWVILGSENDYPWGTSLISDNNIYGLGILYGLVACYYYYPRVKSIFMKLFVITTMLLISFCIILCGSRRGLVSLFLLLVAFIFTNRKAILRAPGLIFKISGRNIIWVTLGLVIISMGIFTEYDKVIDYFSDIQLKLGFLFDKYETIIFGLTEDSRELGARVDRLALISNYLKESSFLQLLLGRGFDYFTILGGDYPHNLFISAILYSGILGTVALAFLYVYIIIEAIKKRSILTNFFFWILFLTCFIFFFSDNSIFSSATYTILMVIVLAIKSEQPAQNIGNEPVLIN